MEVKEIRLSLDTPKDTILEVLHKESMDMINGWYNENHEVYVEGTHSKPMDYNTIVAVYTRLPSDENDQFNIAKIIGNNVDLPNNNYKRLRNSTLGIEIIIEASFFGKTIKIESNTENPIYVVLSK